MIMEQNEERILLERAAIAAMQGLLSDELSFSKERFKNMDIHQWVASEALKYAEALVKELKNNKCQ